MGHLHSPLLRLDGPFSAIRVIAAIVQNQKATGFETAEEAAQSGSSAVENYEGRVVQQER
jgi:hypothetical protein